MGQCATELENSVRETQPRGYSKTRLSEPQRNELQSTEAKQWAMTQGHKKGRCKPEGHEEQTKIHEAKKRGSEEPLK